jgi:hypothetical protein
VSGQVTSMETARQGIPAIIVGDEGGLRRLAELLAPYMPVPAVVPDAEPDRWLCTREAAEYAGCSRHALHRAMAAREVHFEQDVPGGKAWFKRVDIDAWRRGEWRGSKVRRAA